MLIGVFILFIEIMGALKENLIFGYITIFGGYFVCCVVGLVVLEVLFDGDLIVGVVEKEVLFKKLFVHSVIKEVCGKGLMLVVEFESFEFNKKIIDCCIENGVIIDWFLHCSNFMCIVFFFIITKEEIEKVCEVILEVVKYYS